MILAISYLLIVVALITLIRKSRDSRERAVIVTMFKDRNAMAFGGVWTIGPLVTVFISDGFRGIRHGLVGALVYGFVAAAGFHVVSKWRKTTKS